MPKDDIRKLVETEITSFHTRHRPITFTSPDGTYFTLSPEDIAFIKTSPSGLTIITKTGKSYASTEPLIEIRNKLKPLSHFVLTHKDYLVNLEEISRSFKEGRDYGLHFKTIHDTVPVTEANKDKVCRYFNIDSLWLLEGYKKIMAILSKNKIRDFEEDITTFSVERLYKEFSKPSGEINLTNLLYNLIYQAFTWIKEGKMDPIEGNIRSFWYSHFKVVLSTLNMVKEKNYDIMIQAFNKFITEWRITTYKSFGFWDVNYYANKIGRKNPHIILMAEKNGHLFILEKLHREYGITTIALGGQGSSLSIEYFVDAMEEQEIDKKQQFYIFSAVDYDPSGYEIEKSFLSSLRYEGIKNIKSFDIVTLNHFTQEEIESKKYPLFDEGEIPPKDWETRVRNWVRKTKGIGPEGSHWKARAYGIEADAMIKKIREVFLEMAKPYLKKL